MIGLLLHACVLFDPVYAGIQKFSDDVLRFAKKRLSKKLPNGALQFTYLVFAKKIEKVRKYKNTIDSGTVSAGLSVWNGGIF